MKLLEIFVNEAKKQGAEVEIIHLYQENLPLHSGKLEDEFKPSNLQKKLIQADGFVITTPIHWFNVSTPVKIFVDHMTDLEENGWLLEGKVAGFIAYSPEGGEAPALQYLAMTFNHMGVTIPPYSMIFYRGEQDSWAKEDLKLLAKSIVQQIKAQKEFKFTF